MNDDIEITCPHCNTKWKESLSKLEKLESIYKTVSFDVKRNAEKYRACCPNDGTYVIIEVAEEENHG